MKKAFIILIGLLTVVSVFATAFEVTPSATETNTINTTVKLSLNDDYATVWFSKEAANTEAISEYALSLKNPGSLIQDTRGNVQSDDKIYAGGAIGASYQLAKEHALTNRKKYFAIAKLGNDGHVFAFNKLVLPLNPNNNGGCDRHCEDDLDKVCGCADNACTGSKYYIDLIK